MFRHLTGESAAVNDDVCRAWKDELHEKLKIYEPRNVYNADETDLFLNASQIAL